MKKIIICNVPMKEKLNRCRYAAADTSINVSDREVVYPVNAFLEKNLKKDDDVKLILLIKKDKNGFYAKNSAQFIEELLSVNKEIGAKIEHCFVETDFSEDQTVHEQLLGRIVDELDDGAHITADITYGPKDLPIVLFYALGFAEKFLSCELDRILYGKATFVNDTPTNTVICDMLPLYYLNAATSAIRCDDPTKARKLLKTLLSL